jgi:hypothetical protein
LIDQNFAVRLLEADLAMLISLGTAETAILFCPLD